MIMASSLKGVLIAMARRMDGQWSIAPNRTKSKLGGSEMGSFMETTSKLMATICQFKDRGGFRMIIG